MDYAILIDGELVETLQLHTRGQYLPLIVRGRRDWYLAKDYGYAKEQAVRQWKEMDGGQLVSMIGADKIVDAWMRGQSMEDWLEENIEPESEFGSYDGNELEVQDIEDASDEELDIDDLSDDTDDDTEISDRQMRRDEILEAWHNLIDEIGFVPTIAYRHN